MALSILSFLLGNPMGKKFALAGLFFIMIVIILWRVYAAGKKSAKKESLERKIGHLKERIKIDAEISQLDSSERRKRLAEWVRN